MTDDNSLETVLMLISQIEDALMGLKQLRDYIGPGIEREKLELMIEDGETKLAEIKRKVIQ